MPTPRASQSAYRVLIVLFSLAFLYQAGVSWAHIDELRLGNTFPRWPFLFGFRMNVISGMTPEAQAAGLKNFDPVLKLDGKEFYGERVLDDVLKNKRAGDTIQVVAQRPGQPPFTTLVKLAPDIPNPTWRDWMFVLAIVFVLPFLCLALGFWVAFARPWDRNAWLLLALMIGFSQFVVGFSWDWPLRGPAFLWHASTGHGLGAWLVWIVLFGIYFPEPLRYDRRWPWLKWFLLAPLIAETVLLFWFQLAIVYNFEWAGPIRPILNLDLRFPFTTIFAFVALSVFFACIAIQGSTATTPDSRRRLRILYYGTATSFSPLLLASIYSLYKGSDILYGLPSWAEVISLLALLLFPLTLAYVIVVQRAMEARMVVRQGLRYALARRSLWVVRALLIAGASFYITYAFSHRRVTDRVLSILALALAILLRARLSDAASKWLDRRFFREAYQSELVLSELSADVRRFTDSHQLLSTVANRISGTLHVTSMAIFIRNEDRFCVSETIGPEPVAAYCLPAHSESVRLLSEAASPERVYFDDPRSWVHAAEVDEQQKLRDLNAEVLLALPGRDSLLGLIALGPKLSDEPYSPSDLRLLQSVASQTGFALENAQLLQTVAHETASRERLNREIEIAREVQQRLFPQTCPPVNGLDYCGHCRPALAVGGDYYDFLPRSHNRLAIALGDVSGKGISAALMMASLHSLMRGQIAAGLDNLSILLQNTNQLIYESSTSNRYVTFFYSEYDSASRVLTYVNAGHNAPIVLRGDEVFRLEACGPVIGLLPRVEYTTAQYRFEPGDIFVIYTDGISEAMTLEEEEWGEDRLIEAIRRASDRSADQILPSVFGAADAFTQGAGQYDDMTLIVACIL